MGNIDPAQPQRIVVVGTSCSGKTTLARNLAAVLSIPHIELDALHWKPNWTSTPTEELRPLVQEALTPARWTVDGNYGKLGDIVWGRATTIIWLNYKFPVVIGRYLRRTSRRIMFREELWAGNRETLRRTFSRDSLLLWILQQHRRYDSYYPQLFREPQNQHLNVIELRSPPETRQFLSELKSLQEEYLQCFKTHTASLN